jgi:hypothetical protein
MLLQESKHVSTDASTQLAYLGLFPVMHLSLWQDYCHDGRIVSIASYSQ